MATSIYQHVIDWDKIIGTMVNSLEKNTLLQEQLKNMLDDWSHNPVYFRECRTVVAGCGRQNGKTRWVVRHADDETLIVTRHRAIRETIRHRLVTGYQDEIQPKPELKTKIMVAHVLKYLTEQQKFSKIIVDEASFIFNEFTVKKFFKMMMDHVRPDTMFYLIG